MTEQKLTSLTEILERVSRIRAEKTSTVPPQKAEVDPELSQEIEKMRSEFERDGIEYTEGALIGMAECRVLKRRYDEKAAERFAQIAAIPQRFAKASLSDFDPFDDVQQNAFLRICHWAKAVREGETPWLVISGTWGTGKSHLACAALNSLRESKGLTVRFVATMDLVRAVQGTYGNQKATTSEAEITAELARLDVLCLDDIAADPSSFEAKLLARILDARYRNDKPTVLVTNLGIEETSGQPSKFDQYVGDLVASRTRQCADFVEIKTTDFRRGLRDRINARKALELN